MILDYEASAIEPSKFDGIRIREELAKPVEATRLPAIDVLARQLEKSKADIAKKAPNASHQQVAFNLSLRFFDTSLYQRISEQAMFGPKDYERFDDPAALAPKLPEISKGIADAENLIRRNRASAQILKQEAWLYVDQGKHKTDYRIYLSPDPTAIGKVFADLALAIPEHVKYQMKTFDDPSKAVEVSRLDKIIVYCPEGDFDTILDAVNKVYAKNEQSFRGRPAPGGGTISPAEGVSITKQPEKSASGQQVTGTQQVADTIEQRMSQRLPNITQEYFKRSKNAMDAGQSDGGKAFWTFMEAEQEALSGFWYAGQDRLDDVQKKALSSAYTEAVWSATVYHYAEGKPLSISEIRQTFLKKLQGRVQLTPRQLQYLTTEKMSEFQDEKVKTMSERALRKTGLTLALDYGLTHDQPPKTTLQRLLV